MALEFAHRASVERAGQEIADVCRLMHQRNYLAARDGNVSVRIGSKRILVTPSGARKGFMSAKDMVLCDLDGNPVPGETNKPSTETMMHTLIYQERPDVNAVVHAHPPCAIAHTIAGIGLDKPLMPEVFCELGEIATIPYTTPGTREVPDTLREHLTCRVALVMERHGSITMGETLWQAYDRLEILEHTARISLMAHQLGKAEGMPGEELEKLRVFFGCGLGC